MERREGRQLKIQVGPVRVVFLAEPDLPGSTPPLQLLLEVDGVVDVAKAPVESEAIDPVGRGEARGPPALCSATRRSRLLVMPTYRVP